MGIEFRLVFNGHIYIPQANALMARVAQILEHPNFGSLNIIFSSEGGSTDVGLALYNFIRALPTPITIHASGHIGSAAIPVYCAGHRRTCSPLSRFFFHTYDWGFEGRQVLARIDEAVQRLNSDIDLARQIVKKHTKIPDETLQIYYRATATSEIIPPDRAVELGLVDEIVELNEGGVEQPNVAIWTVGWQQ